MSEALLGLPGEYIELHSTASLYATKVGGCPVASGAFGDSPFGAVECGVCSSRLALVFQVAFILCAFLDDASKLVVDACTPEG